jgi:hypothetical protein
MKCEIVLITPLTMPAINLLQLCGSIEFYGDLGTYSRPIRLISFQSYL